VKTLKGKVKKWLDERGYGFISSEDYSSEIFVHSSNIEGKSSLNEGEEVEFEIENSDKGPRAVKVKSVSK
jgi:CspA family cold shock protein